MFENGRTLLQTPLVGGTTTNNNLDEFQNNELDRARITAILESSIRTDMTIKVDRESGKVIEESGSYLKNQ